MARTTTRGRSTGRSRRGAPISRPYRRAADIGRQASACHRETGRGGLRGRRKRALAREEEPAEATGGKAAKLLVAFTDESVLSRCLSLLGDVGSPPGEKRPLRLYSGDGLVAGIRRRLSQGEKRFSFMWELALKTSEGAIFLLTTDADKEHAAFFSARAACSASPSCACALAPAFAAARECR